jgi:hypothetical protein
MPPKKKARLSRKKGTRRKKSSLPPSPENVVSPSSEDRDASNEPRVLRPREEREGNDDDEPISSLVRPSNASKNETAADEVEIAVPVPAPKKQDKLTWKEQERLRTTVIMLFHRKYDFCEPINWKQRGRTISLIQEDLKMSDNQGKWIRRTLQKCWFTRQEKEEDKDDWWGEQVNKVFKGTYVITKGGG